MKKLFTLIILMATTFAIAQDITGTWNGKLEFQGVQLRMVVNISQNEAGEYNGTMDSPDQGAKGIPLGNITFTNNSLAFSVPAAGVQYKGDLKDGIITGTFNQAGTSLPLNLSKGLGVNRPQEPKAPFPYYSEDITFKNEKEGITLAGTLTLPEKTGNYPAVILISGSGPSNRNEEIADHKPFLLLADHLTKNGIAVLRFDDRGVGESGGDFQKATSADFATDVEAAFKYLKTRPEINKKKIGLLGHSEGGMIAPMVAEKNDDVAFVVLLAGPGIKISELMVLQNYTLGKISGVSEEVLASSKAQNKKIYDVVINESDPKIRKEKVTALFKADMGADLAAQGATEEQIDRYAASEAQGILSPWFVYFLKYNPEQALKNTKCPILALNGSKDVQVTPDENLNGIKLATSANKKVTIKKMDELNHLFQECKTGLPQEYGNIEQTMSPVVLSEISGWIKQQVK
ncbi:alpha/beta hydrolase family protein [Flavobacterium sp.]|uniref:alpha/beta hydrolase family protein n=1 Tax=Flavobacterium sp. TaxID=239 RepID=UPI003A91DE77